MNEIQEQILLGTLLGDASLRKSHKTPQLRITHGIKQFNYLKWKMEKLNNITWRINKRKDGTFSAESRVSLR